MNTPLTVGGGRTDIETVGSLELGVVLDVLRNRRRRLVLDYLDENSPAPFDDVVDYVVREEAGLGYSERERKRVHVALYQNHVHRLDDARVVMFEATDKPLSRGPEFEGVYDALERLRDEANDDPAVRAPWKSLRALLRGG